MSSPAYSKRKILYNMDFLVAKRWNAIPDPVKDMAAPMPFMGMMPSME